MVDENAPPMTAHAGGLSASERTPGDRQALDAVARQQFAAGDVALARLVAATLRSAGQLVVQLVEQAQMLGSVGGLVEGHAFAHPVTSVGRVGASDQVTCVTRAFS